jgi:hypothetical protein
MNALGLSNLNKTTTNDLLSFSIEGYEKLLPKIHSADYYCPINL